ncbi:hypothetical protein [Hephaestia mangrovi]|uniref:hypothetical protein n=1 Tax=Hephaestia mangrovi TaxID=2873268 RepID=UPI001CA76E31|nr:hypothetical protein [Hephaestia mangrovi]MBY8827651.1 hypothetical protein [Hephaestia mangrovi]
MTEHLHPAAGDAQTVTASALVRQFGLWQERAARAPVYILHRGRARLALTSVELMEAMCAPSRPEEDIGDTLLDTIGDIVVIVDAALAIARTSAAARQYFSIGNDTGIPLAQLAPGPATDFLVETAARVIARGAAETIEIVSSRRSNRLLSMTIQPWARGAALFAHDVTLEEERKDATSHVRALDQALAAVEDAAAARINLRGYLESPTPSLAALTGIAVETLASVRFVTLFEVGSRVAVAEAIEAVIADGAPRGVSAMMPVNRAGSRPVRIGLSLLRRGVAPNGVAAILVGDDPAENG